jgi:DNA-binding transcriptional LysR family regulator
MRRSQHTSRRLKLRQLEVLLAVAQWGGMAKAAKHLATSQPVVSKTIADLENALGVRLFDRSPRAWSRRFMAVHYLSGALPSLTI